MAKLTAAQLLRRVHDAFDQHGLRDTGSAAGAVLEAVQERETLVARAAAAALPSTFLAANGISRERAALILEAAFAGHELAAPAPLLIPIEEIDSFAKAREVAPHAVQSLVYPLPLLEDDIKATILDIIGEPFVQPHSGSELSDIFTPRVRLRGHMVAAAFLLKGRGLPRPMRPANLGGPGDQITRLTRAPAELFVVQHVHEIDQAVWTQFRHAIAYLRMHGNDSAVGSVWDGATLARLLLAQGVAKVDGDGITLVRRS